MMIMKMKTPGSQVDSQVAEGKRREGDWRWPLDSETTDRPTAPDGERRQP